MKKLMITVMTLCQVSCGEAPADDASDYKTEKTELTTDLIFKGYVQNAFKVTVNGNDYDDIEQYYTHQADDMAGLLVKAGYEGYQWTLDGQLGMSDLYDGMDVYIAPYDHRGYLGKANVNSHGGFEISLPADAADNDYQVRANKRIGITLTGKADSLRYCFNFSAVDKSVLFSDKEKPIILDKFETSLTKYDCGQKKTDLPLPVNANAGAGNLIIRSISTTKDVLRILGTTNLTVADNRYIWNDGADGQHPDQCQAEGNRIGDCYIDFIDGKVFMQTNINQKYLDIPSF